MSSRRAPGPVLASARGWRASVAIGSLLLLSACAAVPVNADRAAFAAAPSRNAVPRATVRLVPASTLLLDVRLDRQVSSNGCGAHAVAAVIDYWNRADPPSPARPVPTGLDIHARTPPASPAGYSLAEVVGLLQGVGMVAAAVGSTPDAIRGELAAGRPVIARVSVSAGYLATVRLFAEDAPLVGEVESMAADVTARLLEPMSVARIEHYWVVVGHDAANLIVLDPALGLRVVRTEAFARAFGRGGSLAVVVGGWR